MYSFLIAIYSYFLNPILTLLLFILFAYVVMSWLVMGGVLSLGQLDLSVFLLALGILFTRDWLLPTVIGLFRPSLGY
jgi:YggT family protein